MIAKLPKVRRDGKSSFRDLVRYCLGITGHAEGSVLHVGSQNLLHDTEEAYKEMEEVASQNTRCKVPAMHFILSWREMESPSNEQVDEAVKIALRELELEDCQAIWALQNDTENLHVHVVVNRISLETYRPVRSNGGWTKKALEKAARKIEITQGWELEKSGRYEVVDDEGKLLDKYVGKKSVPELSQTARDIEAHTGVESLERIVKRDVSFILEESESWEELHFQLASKGYELERKGNGAVLKIGNQAVKLSRVSRSSSFSKLEQRLGKYEERKPEVKIFTSGQTVTQSISKATHWEEYQKAREKYFESKKLEVKKLKLRQREEREQLHEIQKRRWEELHSESWKGRRNELNQLRCWLAFAHKKEQLNLRDAQRGELEKLRDHYPRRFPLYKEWLLKNCEGYCVGDVMMLSPRNSALPPVEAAQTTDLRNYEVRLGAGGSLLYCRAGKLTADFSDMGKKIVLNKKALSEETVLSALQLANAKWGATEITGNAEYQELCISLAVKHGLKLANPDLSAEVERRRLELAKELITVAEVASLNLVSEPKIYINPRMDNQRYKGEIIHIDNERGICIQLVGKQSLIVHKLDNLVSLPEVGEMLKISYSSESEKAKIQQEANHRRLRRL